VVIQGEAPLRLVEDQLGIELKEAHEATIGGHVVESMGRLPRPGEVVQVDGRPLEVTRVGEARVKELRAEAASGAQEGSGVGQTGE
ncbi:MAG: hypothetical protein M3088_02105, partial [Actinomycetota bacterium]|nr:hypothetical protein [Actinomycetota bacterium]